MPNGLSPVQFIAKWSRADLPERAASQEHFIDLCRMLGQPTPAEHDATGAEYTFEKGVAVTAAASVRSKGERGFADVWWRGKFAWEYKRKEKYRDLTEAYRQLCQYREALENPPLLIVSDIARTEIHTNFTGTRKDVHVVPLAEFDRPESIDKLRRVFADPESFKPTLTTATITEEAAAQFARIAEGLRDRRHDPHVAAHFLMKCMFCLFAEDVGLLPEQVFTRLLERYQYQPERLTDRLTELFARMRTGGDFGTEPIAYFNGGLFDERPVPPASSLHESPPSPPQALELRAGEIGAMLRAAQHDWGAVEPAIFGTLFERSLDPGKRAQIGAHYTSRDDIMLIVEPVVIAPLRCEWQAVRVEVEALLEKRRQAGAPLRLSKRADPKAAATVKKAERAIADALESFLTRLSSIRILDPACGSGNFLYVAIQRLLDLEKEVITFAARPDIGLGLFPRVRPTQLHGIEINAYAAELAQVVVWIGYLQWMRDNGFVPPRDPILAPLQTIECRDAILDFLVPAGEGPRERIPAEVRARKDSRTSKSRTSGSPPAAVARIPSRTQPIRESLPTPHRPRQGPTTVARGDSAAADEPLERDPQQQPAPNGGGRTPPRAVPAQWPNADFIIGNPPFLGGNFVRRELGDEYVHALFAAFDLPNFSDLCCYWFEQARRQLEHHRHLRVGLLATQAIRGGANREVLKRIKTTGGIFMAWSDREWILEGAAVHVSMIGFDAGAETVRMLDAQTVSAINANLTAGTDLTTAAILPGNLSIQHEADKKGAPFELTWEDARQILRAPRLYDGEPLSVCRPWANGLDVTRRWRAIWIIDFGSDMPLEQAAQFDAAFQHVVTHVAPEYQSKRKRWWLHERPRPDMRAALAPLSRYVATPVLTKYRLFTWLNHDVLPDHQLVVFARDDDYFFGVLHNSIHELWARRMGTQLREAESGFRYTPTTCFETFPMPWPPGSEPRPAAAGSGYRDDHARDRAGGGRPLADARGSDLYRRISEAARELNEQRERWLNPPEWIEPLAAEIEAADKFADVPPDARPLIRQSAVMAAAAKDPRLKKRTLTNLYNERPTWLRLAHEKLDRAVLAAYAATDPAGEWSESWAELWTETGAGLPLPDGHRLVRRRAEIDQRVLANLLRLNLVRADNSPYASGGGPRSVGLRQRARRR